VEGRQFMKNKLMISLLAISILFLASCSFSKQSKCQIDTLVFDTTSFPDYAHIGRLLFDDSKLTRESVYREYSYDSYHIFIYIDDWYSTQYATFKYADEVKGAFMENKYSGPWIKPQVLFSPSYSNNHFEACGIAHGTNQCRYMASYNEYLVYLKFDAFSNQVPITKFNELIQEIDKKFSTCIYN
jgi:hypothetical protein